MRILRESRSPEMYKQARAELMKLTGADKPKLKGLGEPAQILAYALSLAVEPMATGDDLRMLFRLWTDSKGFQLLDHRRILRHGDEGRAFMASLFGRTTASHYANEEQSLAGEALLAIDEKAAIASARALLAQKEMSEAHAWGLRSMLEARREERSRRSGSRCFSRRHERESLERLRRKPREPSSRGSIRRPRHASSSTSTPSASTTRAPCWRRPMTRWRCPR
jgi:hypothetical protein